MAVSTDFLSDEEVSAFQRDGFLVIKDFVFSASLLPFSSYVALALVIKIKVNDYILRCSSSSSGLLS